jgi:hypothetical protein
MTVAEQDAALREKLLGREGGSLGVNQSEWNGLAPHVKANMVSLAC